MSHVESTPFQRYAAEAAGTFILVLAGCGAVVADNFLDGALGPFGIAAAFGAALLAVVYSIGHISGAHVNPAITLAFAAARDFPVKHAVGYIVAQVLGAVLAASVLRLLFGDVANLGAPGPTVSIAAAFGAELVFAFMLMFVVESLATDTRAIGSMAGLGIGSTLLLGVLLAGPLSGGSLNPARAVGPALVSGTWSAHWVYWVAPILGALVGAFTYRMIRTRTLAEAPARRQAAVQSGDPALAT